jgi:hypothetical protein
LLCGIIVLVFVFIVVVGDREQGDGEQHAARER